MIKEKITAIIPTFNEEKHIRKAIKSVIWADEIIVIDSFSKDKTLDIAREYNVKIVQNEYKYSAHQKNYIIPKATYNWIILLDADEEVSSQLKDEIINTVNSNPKFDGYWIKRDNMFMGKKIRYGNWKNDRVIRLFKRDTCKYEDKRVHAEIISDGKIGELKCKIKHDTFRNLDNYLFRLTRYARWKAKDRYVKTSKVGFYHLSIRPGFYFFKSYILKLGILDGLQGFILSCLGAYSLFIRYLMIMEQQQNEKANK